MEIGGFREGLQGEGEGGAGAAAEDELPGVALGALLVEGGGGGGNVDIMVPQEEIVVLFYISQDGFLGLIGEAETGEVGEGRETGFPALF